MRFGAAAAVALLLSSASSHSPLRAAAPAEGQRSEPVVPFRVGETLTYDVSWSSLLVAGTAVATIKEKQASGNSSAYYIVADGRPLTLLSRIYPLYYKLDALVDAKSLLSQRSSLHSEERNRRRTATTTFDRGARKALFEVESDTIARSEFAVPTETQDGLSALYAARSLALRPGARLEMPVVNDGELFTVGIDVGGPERIRVPIGQVEALELRLNVVDTQRQPAGKNMAIWISTDARRLPVKLQAELPVGSFVLALREAR